MSFHFIVDSNDEVDEVIGKAVAAGGRIVRDAADAKWGGYFGYFADPDGYLWKARPRTEARRGPRAATRSQEQAMKFRTHVEPPEPMRGLEVPPAVVEALGGGKRPAVTITINGHSWKSRVAVMRGRNLLGLSNANRRAAGVSVGDEVEVEVELDTEPRVVVEPEDFARALDADPAARAAYDRLSHGRKREHVLKIDGAKKAETRTRRIETALATLRTSTPANR